MNASTFNTGLEELKDIFPRFKLSAAQQATWFRRLEKYSDDAMKHAVKWMCDREEQPSYYRLKHALTLYKGKAEVNWDKIETQGLAPFNEEFRKLGGACSKRLWKALGEKNRETRGKILEETKVLWQTHFRRITGYVQPNEVQRLVDQKDMGALKRLGVPEVLGSSSAYSRSDVIFDKKGRKWVNRQYDNTEADHLLRRTNTFEYSGGYVMPSEDDDYFF